MTDTPQPQPNPFVPDSPDVGDVEAQPEPAAPEQVVPPQDHLDVAPRQDAPTLDEPAPAEPWPEPEPAVTVDEPAEEQPEPRQPMHLALGDFSVRIDEDNTVRVTQKHLVTVIHPDGEPSAYIRRAPGCYTSFTQEASINDLLVLVAVALDRAEWLPGTVPGVASLRAAYDALEAEVNASS